MRSMIKWSALLGTLVIIAGCPFLNNSSRTFTSADVGNGGLFGDGLEVDAGAENDAPTNDTGGERTVVEPDVVRREGNLLYVLNQFRGMSIVDLDTDTLLVQVPTFGVPKDMYFDNGVAYVLVSSAQTISTEDGTVSVSTTSRMYVVDVQDPAKATIQSQVDVTGTLVDSRLVGAVLYVVSANYDYGYGYTDEVAFADYSGETLVTSINVSNPSAPVQADQVTLSGSGQVIHVTSEAAFVATNDWNSNRTTIVYLDITDPAGTIREVGTMSVRGYVGDRFKLDAWNSVLRVVSSDWQGTNQVYVSTFDLNDPALVQLAEMRVEGAEGETLFATRFDGARAYIVTFLVVDPLFVLDLADPANPELLGALEVPGYSTHIEARGDRLIALGVDDTDGRQVSVSIFDVSGNGAPSLLDRVSFGGEWSWSSAYNDVKALSILDDVIIVPFSGWSDQQGGFDRLQFVSMAGDALTLRGNVDLRGSILRSFDYGVDYFGLTTEELSRIDAGDLDQPKVVSSIVLAENVVDFIAVSDSVSVALIARLNDDQLLVRTLDGSQQVLDELVVDVGYYQSAWVSGKTLAIVGIIWEDSGAYEVRLVDMSEAGTLSIGASINVAVDPYYAYYGFDIYGDVGVPEAGVAATDAIGYPYYYGGSGDASAYLLDDTLVLRCFSERFDRVIGGTSAYQGLALVDLEAARWTETIGLGYDNAVSLDARGDKLYLGVRESTGIALFAPPMVAYSVQELDVLQGVDGPLVNVPGSFLDYDNSTGVLTLLDHQWRSNQGVEATLETVRWDGGATVESLHSLAMSEDSYGHRATEGRVYVEQYGNRGGLLQIRTNSVGAFSTSERVAYGSNYGYLFDASGDEAFVIFGNGAVAHYQFKDGEGTLNQIVQVSGYPSSIRVANDVAYISLGYYGVASLPL